MATKPKTPAPETDPGTDPTGQEGNGQAPDPTATGAGTGDAGTTEGTGEAGTSGEKKTTRKKAPDTSGIKLDDIEAAVLVPADFRAAGRPTRERNEQQKKMDTMAQRAYDAWVEAEMPSVWDKMPIVTYFLNEDEVTDYRYLITQAAKVVIPRDGSSGARARIGNEFTLSEKMAAKLTDPETGEVGRPELAGKIVLMWTILDKREAKSPATKAAEKKEDREKNE
jgi:hypothetical protein